MPKGVYLIDLFLFFVSAHGYYWNRRFLMFNDMCDVKEKNKIINDKDKDKEKVCKIQVFDQIKSYIGIFDLANIIFDYCVSYKIILQSNDGNVFNIPEIRLNETNANIIHDQKMKYFIIKSDNLIPLVLSTVFEINIIFLFFLNY